MLYDLSFLKELSNNDEVFIKEIVDQFISELSIIGEYVYSAYQERDFEAEYNYLHKIKSPLTNFKSILLIAFVDQLEVFASNKVVSEAHEKLATQFKDTMALLNKELNENEL